MLSLIELQRALIKPSLQAGPDRFVSWSRNTVVGFLATPSWLMQPRSSWRNPDGESADRSLFGTETATSSRSRCCTR